ncbi:MAG: hypothetical protein EBQ89_05275, partial [Alphaproteobacteria bacterium]|nr:hypothetical protein [Alphaproteobacteria bacterium]
MPPKTIPLISDTRRAQAGLVLAVEVVVIDLLSKWAVFTFVLNDAVTKTITPFFNLVIVWNRGVTFGLLGDVTIQHQAYILSGVGLLVVVALGVWLFKTSSALQALALGLVMGGALGNIYDRIIYGA